MPNLPQRHRSSPTSGTAWPSRPTPSSCAAISGRPAGCSSRPMTSSRPLEGRDPRESHQFGQRFHRVPRPVATGPPAVDLDKLHWRIYLTARLDCWMEVPDWGTNVVHVQPEKNTDRLERSRSGCGVSRTTRVLPDPLPRRQRGEAREGRQLHRRPARGRLHGARRVEPPGVGGAGVRAAADGGVPRSIASAVRPADRMTLAWADAPHRHRHRFEAGRVVRSSSRSRLTPPPRMISAARRRSCVFWSDRLPAGSPARRGSSAGARTRAPSASRRSAARISRAGRSRPACSTSRPPPSSARPWRICTGRGERRESWRPRLGPGRRAPPDAARLAASAAAPWSSSRPPALGAAVRPPRPAVRAARAADAHPRRRAARERPGRRPFGAATGGLGVRRRRRGAWDVALAMASALGPWLSSIPQIPAVPPERLLREAALPLAGIRPGLATLWLAYADGSRADLPAPLPGPDGGAPRPARGRGRGRIRGPPRRLRRAPPARPQHARSAGPSSATASSACPWLMADARWISWQRPSRPSRCEAPPASRGSASPSTSPSLSAGWRQPTASAPRSSRRSHGGSTRASTRRAGRSAGGPAPGGRPTANWRGPCRRPTPGPARSSRAGASPATTTGGSWWSDRVCGSGPSLARSSTTVPARRRWATSSPSGWPTRSRGRRPASTWLSATGVSTSTGRDSSITLPPPPRGRRGALRRAGHDPPERRRAALPPQGARRPRLLALRHCPARPSAQGPDGGAQARRGPPATLPRDLEDSLPRSPSPSLPALRSPRPPATGSASVPIAAV